MNALMCSLKGTYSHVLCHL